MLFIYSHQSKLKVKQNHQRGIIIMKLLEKMTYVECFMIIMATWFMFISYSHGANVAAAPGTNGLDTAWYDARAAYYGDIHGGGTERKLKLLICCRI